MNCINHPDTAVAAYCQQCGKPLCAQCVRSVSGIIYCEACLATRLGVPPSGSAGTSVPPAAPYTVPPIPPVGGPNPSLAAFLGFIPGVGAMYNGQFVKALVHVLVFAILVSLADEHGVFGMFVAAWVFYQVFDAHQTAKARRDGLPLPDPFGLNDLGSKLGVHGSSTAHHTYTPPVNPYAGVPPTANVPPTPPPGSAYGNVPPVQPPYVAAAAPTTETPYAPVEPPVPEPGKRPEPIGAIILIALGLLFLFQSLGFMGSWWIGHSWPWILIAIGAWLLFRRLNDSAGGAQ